jgi:hypothetical protein
VKKIACVCGALLFLLGASFVIYWQVGTEKGDERLAGFLHARPPVAIVFTSRSEPASFRAASPSGNGFTYPGQPHWQASEGRLRVLTPRGAVRELTWNVALLDGDRLIDVMCPNVSLDATRVIFAGRRAGDHGRFRLYEIGIDGTGLKQLTGQAEDPGAVALPPMRFQKAGYEAWPLQAIALCTLPAPGLPINQAIALVGGPKPLPEAKRKWVDYDDVDPLYLPDGRIAFMSSRIPDLGRGHARRAMHLWVMRSDGSGKYAVTANRNSDRWPSQLGSLNTLTFSEWSRNTEVVTGDLTDIQPYHPGMNSATKPTDNWQALRVAPNGDQFGMVLKLPIPVWRPHELANGNILFMTTSAYRKPDWNPESPAELTIAQAPLNLAMNSGSALPHNVQLPGQEPDLISLAPRFDAEGRRLTLATPSPCLDGQILLSGAASDPNDSLPGPGSFGLYLASETWDVAPGQPIDPAALRLRLLFDDPDFVDAEPVAVVPRKLRGDWGDLSASPGRGKTRLELVDGIYEGPVGKVTNADLFLQAKAQLPGQRSDAQEGPIMTEPPGGLLDHIRFFASYRDRFDHPLWPRVEGPWKLLLKVPLTSQKREMVALLPVGIPTVLAGFTSEGKVGQWTSAAKDSQKRQATFLTFAGDHYNSVSPGGVGFCMGCHPGHTAMLPVHPPGLRR